MALYMLVAKTGTVVVVILVPTCWARHHAAKNSFLSFEDDLFWHLLHVMVIFGVICFAATCCQRCPKHTLAVSLPRRRWSMCCTWCFPDLAGEHCWSNWTKNMHARTYAEASAPQPCSNCQSNHTVTQRIAAVIVTATLHWPYNGRTVTVQWPLQWPYGGHL